MREIATLDYEQFAALDYEQLGLTPDRFDNAEPSSPPPQPAPRRGFIRRQFDARATRTQKIFDALVGVVLPLVCLYFDPVVFRSAGFGMPLLGGYRIFAYAVIALEVALLALWLVLGERVREWGGMLGGALMAGALFSLVVGVVLLPFSVLGLMLLIGALGFSPLLTAFVYWRNGRRALRASATRLEGTRRALALAFGATLALGAPAYAHLRVAHAVSHAVEQLTAGDGAQAFAATRRLKVFGWIAPVELDSLAWSYAREPDATKKARLARAYRELTGSEVEDRLTLLND